VTIRVRAPATTANVGPGFDCAGVAVDLWNELEVLDGPDEEGAAADHLGVQAYALLASPAGRSLRFTSRIPQKRGLGSSAAVIALGLVAGALAAGEEPDPERLLGLGLPLEGHADNLAAALAGGACLTWSGRIARVAESLPLVPVAVVPRTEVSTAEARAALPAGVPFADAVFTAGRAALLGAAFASGDADLLAAALDDRLHQPYRAATAPLFDALRAAPPTGAAGVTISGSGPTVVVWARPGEADACAAELAGRFPDAEALPLRGSAAGAGPF
jgi:homoserine kinase